MYICTQTYTYVYFCWYIIFHCINSSHFIYIILVLMGSFPFRAFTDKTNYICTILLVHSVFMVCFLVIACTLFSTFFFSHIVQIQVFVKYIINISFHLFFNNDFRVSVTNLNEDQCIIFFFIVDTFSFLYDLETMKMFSFFQELYSLSF